MVYSMTAFYTLLSSGILTTGFLIFLGLLQHHPAIVFSSYAFNTFFLSKYIFFDFSFILCPRPSRFIRAIFVIMTKFV